MVKKILVSSLHNGIPKLLLQLLLVSVVAPALALPLPPEMTEGGVLFQYEDPIAEQVNLGGEFNQWNDKTLPMTKEGEGKFVLVVPLKEGKYKYKYIIDGQWMSGEDLTLNIIQREGRLYIYPRQPYLRFPYSSKIGMDGYYLFISALSDDVDGPGGKIRSQTPRNDIDLNFDIHPTDILKAWAQLNINTVNNDDKVNLDEAFLELKLGQHFVLKPFETHWSVEFDDPFRVLDAHVQQFDDNIYLTDDPRPFYFQYGRYARGFSGDIGAGKWLARFFFSNKVRLDQGSTSEDLWGFRLKRAGPRLSYGFTFTQWQIPNGIKADENADGQTTEKTIYDLGPTTIEYPENSGSFHQVNFLTQNKPGGQNKKIQTGFDASIAFGGWKVQTEILATQNEAAAIAYSNGFSRRVFGFAYGQSVGTGAGFERIFGEQSDGLSILLGFIFRGRSWDNEFRFGFNNYRAKSFSDSTATASDTGLKNISPDWIEIVHRIRLNRRLDPSWGLDLESRYVDRSSLGVIGNHYYRERVGGTHYFYTEVPWAKTTIEERVRFRWKWGRRMTFHTKLDWMNLDRFGKTLGRDDIQTIVGLPRVNWQMSEKWQMDLGARYASIDFGKIGGVAYSAAFTKLLMGFKYEWSKLFHIRFWWGVDPYLDEDKKLGGDWRVQELFRPASETVATANQDLGFGASEANTLIGTERRFDQESIFALQAELRF